MRVFFVAAAAAVLFDPMLAKRAGRRLKAKHHSWSRLRT